MRLVIKVRPNGLWPVERELRKRIKARFDEEGVEIPYPRQVTYNRKVDDGPVPGDGARPDARVGTAPAG